MARQQIPASILDITLRARMVALVSLTVLAIVLAAVPTLQAQTYKVLHNFTGGADGSNPQAGLAMDRAGNLYGTASDGGNAGFGAIYRLVHTGPNWILYPLYDFQGAYDGASPLGPLTIGPDGAFYGTTLAAGSHGNGVLFRITPPPTVPPSAFTPWDETVLYAFDALGGEQPVYPQLIFDQAGNLYGAAQFGGSHQAGAVFELSPTGGGWTEQPLYTGFEGDSPTGSQPYSGVVMDRAGNLYGTTSIGGDPGDGVVYEISPTQSGWVQTILHSFKNGTDGGLSFGGLVMDQAGNLYGGTVSGGAGCGVIYELSPSNGGWIFAPIYTLPSVHGQCGGGPYETLTLDAAGNLYGTAFADGADSAGMVFKLSNSNGSWTLTDLHDFSFGTEYFPYSAVTIGTDGNLYGTASGGGTYDHGVLWEITP